MVRRATPLRFVLYPMIHIGAPGFYEEVMSGLQSCDLAVVENGAPGSATVAVLTGAYRITTRNRRLGLVTQRLPLAELGVPVVRPDVGATEFASGWGRAAPSASSDGAPSRATGRDLDHAEWMTVFPL